MIIVHYAFARKRSVIFVFIRENNTHENARSHATSKHKQDGERE